MVHLTPNDLVWHLGAETSDRCARHVWKMSQATVARGEAGGNVIQCRQRRAVGGRGNFV